MKNIIWQTFAGACVLGLVMSAVAQTEPAAPPDANVAPAIAEPADAAPPATELPRPPGATLVYHGITLRQGRQGRSRQPPVNTDRGTKAVIYAGTGSGQAGGTPATPSRSW